MKPGLAIGQSYAFELRVTEEMQACFDEEPVHPLYATASMIRHMEQAARQLILPFLEAGEEGVGCHVDVRHLAPARIGDSITVRATVSEISSNAGQQTPRVLSRVEAWHGETLIGNGFFTQAIVPLETLYGLKADPASLPDASSSDVSPPLVQEPEPATLTSRDGRSQFRLSVLRWETPTLPCTRYDEWLVCQVVWETPLGRKFVEGPFLLLYEIEAWQTAMRELCHTAQSGFLSDFLESVLSVRMMPESPDAWTCAIHLEIGENGDPTVRHTLEMVVDTEAIAGFATGLEQQLNGFLSRL